MSLRVAVMDFTVEELSYRSSRAAADFTALLQAELSANLPPGIELVERMELARAEQELRLGAVGLADRRDGLRAGYWARADWAVFGTLLTNTGPVVERQLRLELVELARANVLATTNMPVSSQATTHFAPNSQAAVVLANQLRRLLADEVTQEPTRRAAITAALIPLSGVPPDAVRWTNHTATSTPAIRYLFLDAADRSTDEADRTLAALTVGGSNTPPELAEFFIWPESVPNVHGRFVVWDGRGSPRAVQTSNGLINAVELASCLSHLRAERGSLQPRPEAFHELARSLMKQARFPKVTWPMAARRWALALFLAPGDREIREGWTRFKCTGVPPGHPMWKEERGFNDHRHDFELWGDYLDRFPVEATSGDRPATELPTAGFVTAAFEAVRLTRHGDAKSDVGIPDDIGGEILAKMRRRIVWGVLERLGLILNEQTVRTNAYALLEMILTDMTWEPDPVEAKRRFPAFQQLWELVRTHQPKALGNWGSFPTPLEQFLGAAGRADLVSGYFKEAAEGLRLAKGVERNAGSAPAPQKPLTLPRVHLLDEAGHGSVFNLAGVRFSPPALPIRVHPLALPHRARVRALLGAGQAGGHLWLLMTNEAVLDESRLLPHEQVLQPAGQGLWRVSVDAAMAPVSLPFDCAISTALGGDRDELWFANPEGLTVWNVNSQRFRTLGVPDGLPSGPYFRLAIQGSRILLLGGEVAWSTNSGTTWRTMPVPIPRSPSRPPARRVLPAQANWFPLIFQDRWLLQVRNDRVYHGAFSGAPLCAEQVIYTNQPGVWRQSPVLAPADAGGVWLAVGQEVFLMDFGKFALDPFLRAGAWLRRHHWLPGYLDAGNQDDSAAIGAIREMVQLRRQAAPKPMLSRLTGPVTALLQDGDCLWVAGSSYDHQIVGCYDVRRKGWIGMVPVSGRVTRLVALGGAIAALWPPREGQSEFGCILNPPPQEQLIAMKTVADVIPEPEAMERTEGLTTAVQAAAALFAGFPQITVKLLTKPPETLTAEEMTLLSLAYDREGLNQPDKARRWQQQLREEYPESFYTRALDSASLPAASSLPRSARPTIP